jgi:hypothetical protein
MDKNSKDQLSEVVKHDFYGSISQKDNVIGKWINRIQDLNKMDIFNKGHILYIDSMSLLKQYLI